MRRSLTRREFSRLALALPFAGMLPASSVASSNPIIDLYRRATVIDGNLVPPLDDKPLSKEVVLAVRSSGITAIKATIGGSTGDFAAVSQEIRDFDAAISANATLYMKIVDRQSIDTAKRLRKLGLIYSFEAVTMLDGKLERIDHFARMGVRVMQLSYNKQSPFASGVLTPQPSSGLTPLGKEALQRMQSIGVTVDVSHCDTASTIAACAAAAKPILITHAGCAAVYDHPRNKSDDVLRAISNVGGVVGIYDLSFLTPGPGQPLIDDYLAHLLHALNVCGEDHVGIGSDALLMPFDTSAESVAEWNKDIAARKASGVAAPGEGRPPFVEGLNRPDRSLIIAEKLVARKCPPRIVEKILGLNFLRVFAATWPSHLVAHTAV